MSTTLNTPYATLSFPAVFQPRPRSEGGKPQYHAVLIFSPAQQKSPAYKAMQDAAVAVAREKFGATVKFNTLNMPFKDAGEKAEKYGGYVAGDMYISPWSDNKPGVVDANRNDILLPEEVWAGQLVRANVNAFAWEKAGKRGVSFGLNHLQVIKTDTPRIDGRLSAGKSFDDGLVEGEEAPLF